MQSNRSIVNEELTSLRERIAANIIGQGSNATGKTIRSLAVEVYGTDATPVGILYGRPYFGALETGSRPWQNAERFRRFVPRVFAEQIQEWIDAKHLDLNAYAVAHNIIFRGTSLYREGGRNTIYSREIPATLDRIRERLLLECQLQVVNNIKLNTDETI